LFDVRDGKPALGFAACHDELFELLTSAGFDEANLEPQFEPVPFAAVPFEFQAEALEPAHASNVYLDAMLF
jgi:hypothetical protein